MAAVANGQISRLIDLATKDVQDSGTDIEHLTKTDKVLLAAIGYATKEITAQVRAGLKRLIIPLWFVGGTILSSVVWQVAKVVLGL